MAKAKKKVVKSKKVVRKLSSSRTSLKLKKSTRIKAKIKPSIKSKTKTKTKTKTKIRSTTLDLSAIISPLDNRIIVQLETGERISPGGIILPDTSEMSGNQKGIVVAVGRGRRDSKGKIHPLDVQIGDKVMMSEHAGDSIEILGQKVRILRETDVLGVVQS